MQKRKKNSILCKAFFVATALMLFATALPAEEQKDPWWWQAEIAPAPEGQIINPDFINKRDALERFLSQANRNRGIQRQYFRWTNQANLKAHNTTRSLSTALRLERELAKTPVYVPRPSDTGGTSAAPAQP